MEGSRSAKLQELNNTLAELQQQMDGYCTEIGSMLVGSPELSAEYSNIYSSDNDTVAAARMAISEKIHSFREAEAQLGEIRAQIDKLENGVYCPNCDRELDEDSMFCKYCGTPVHAQPPVEPIPEPEPVMPQRICLNCGFELPEEAVFCPNCGAKN